MKNVLFILHAKAGRGAITQHLTEIVSLFNQAGYMVTVMMTQHKGHAAELIRSEAKKYDLLLVAGGDGTLNEAATGVLSMERPVPIAYLPTGTTNDFAYSVGIPADYKKNIADILKKKQFQVDVGWLNGEKPFLYVAAFGSIVKASYTTPQTEKNVWGYAAYLPEAFDLLHALRPYHLNITYDGSTLEGDYIIGFISNSHRVSGIKGITGKNVSMNDGVFEMTLLKNVQYMAELVRPAAELFQDEPDPRYIERITAKEMTIVSDRPVEWNVDGEYGGTSMVTTMEVLPKALTFYI